MTHEELYEAALALGLHEDSADEMTTAQLQAYADRNIAEVNDEEDPDGYY